MHINEYIKTSDGYWGIVTGETKAFIDCAVDFEDFVLTLRFSKRTQRQYNTPNRRFYFVAYGDVPNA